MTEFNPVPHERDDAAGVGEADASAELPRPAAASVPDDAEIERLLSELAAGDAAEAPALADEIAAHLAARLDPGTDSESRT